MFSGYGFRSFQLSEKSKVEFHVKEGCIRKACKQKMEGYYERWRGKVESDIVTIKPCSVIVKPLRCKDLDLLILPKISIERIMIPWLEYSNVVIELERNSNRKSQRIMKKNQRYFNEIFIN